MTGLSASHVLVADDEPSIRYVLREALDARWRSALPATCALPSFLTVVPVQLLRADSLLRDLSVAFLNSGKPMFTPEALAWFAVMRTISHRVPRTPAT